MPGGVVPSVLVTVPTVQRAEAILGLLGRLPEPAPALISVRLFAETFVPAARPPP